MNAKILGQIRGIVDADDYDAFERMMNPDDYDDEIQLHDDLDQVFGLDLIDYYPRRILNEYFDELLEKAPDSVRYIMLNSREKIIDRAIERKSSNDEEYLYQIILAQIFDETGWAADNNPVSLSKQIFQENDSPSPFIIDDDDEDDDGVFADNEDEDEF